MNCKNLIHNNPISVSSINDLQKTLENAGIDTSNWGKNKNKSLADLYSEISNGETTLILDPKKGIIREVEGAGANVYYTDKSGTTYLLLEEFQILSDEQKRRRYPTTSVSEKMKHGENPFDAIVRGIKEELGISSKINPIKTETEFEEKPSPSYPNLYSKYSKYCFDVFLTDEQYKPEGYYEVENGIKTVFKWNTLQK